jgi:hypothetical protein
LFLLWLSEALRAPSGASPLETTIEQAGALLFVTGALTVVWDLRGRRVLTEEVLAAASLSTDVTAAGLRRVVSRYHEFGWDEELDRASEVDLFFAYARTWRMAHATALRHLVSRRGTRLRVVLPDRDSSELMDRLAAKFGYAVEELQEHIRDAERDFANLRQQALEESVVQVRLTQEFPVFTYYRFDGACVGFLYAQARGRTDVPGFYCERSGALGRFFSDQFEGLWGSSVRPKEESDGDESRGND